MINCSFLDDNKIMCREHETLLKLNFLQLMEWYCSWDSILMLTYQIDVHDLKSGKALSTRVMKKCFAMSMNSALRCNMWWKNQTGVYSSRFTLNCWIGHSLVSSLYHTFFSVGRIYQKTPCVLRLRMGVILLSVLYLLEKCSLCPTALIWR